MYAYKGHDPPTLENKEFEILLDSIQTHIWYFLDPYTYGLANKAHAEFLGLDKYRLHKRRISDVLPQGLAEIAIKENKRVFKEKKHLNITRWFKNHKSETRLLAITKTPVFNSRGEVSSLVCTAQDITRARRNQENLKAKLRLLKSQTIIDSLTDIFNRRYFDETLKREWGRAKRNEKHLSLIMLDIDNFKEYNDNYGHQAGDAALRKVAGALAQTVTRPGDIVTRYGGEEFAVILPQTVAEGAQKLAEKMLTRIEELGIKHEFSPVTNILTLSAGSASILPQGELKDLSQEMLLNKADMALTQAKKEGKNRVRCQEIKLTGLV